MRQRLRTLVVPIVAGAAILGSGGWMAIHGQSVGSWSQGTAGAGAYEMMGDYGTSADRVPVVDLADARERAQEFATSLRPDLTVGEVMQFERQYYAELVEADGSLATEVLIDPVSCNVQVELGPARMWNTRYGMMGRGGSELRISATEAQRVADEWLAGQDGAEGLTAETADAFPGYYTLH